MARKPKPTPLKFCAACGKKLERKRLKNGQLESLLHFGRRPYCDRLCMARAFREKPKTFKAARTGRQHASKLLPPGPCERCGKSDALDVHHRNRNPLDNSLENLERLCRSCHYREHNPVRSCSLCGQPHKGLGYCEKHYQRFKKWGDPLAYKVNQHSPLVRE